MSTTAPSSGVSASTDRLRQQAETLSQRLPSLLVEADRVAATVAPGVHGRRRTGMGETFWQFRLYQSGDAASEIDWRQSARSRHLFIREQEWEAAESVWIWCDLSRSMSFRSTAPLPAKWERAALLALALSALLVRGGERVALLGGGTRPASGRFGQEQLARALTQAAGTREPLPPDDLPAALCPPRADLRLPAADRRAAPAHGPFRRPGGPRHACSRSCDPAEELLPYEGRVLFEGLEQEGAALIDNVGSIRKRYVEVLRAHRETLGALCGRQQWRFATHRTDRPAETALLSLVAMLAPRARH